MNNTSLLKSIEEAARRGAASSETKVKEEYYLLVKYLLSNIESNALDMIQNLKGGA